MSCLAILSLIWFLGVVFHTDDTTWFQLPAAIRAKLSAYCWASMWILAVAFNMLDTWVTCVQHQLHMLQIGELDACMVPACACVVCPIVRLYNGNP